MIGVSTGAVQALEKWGFLHEGISANQAVRKFQRHFGLTVDGHVGPVTEHALELLPLLPRCGTPERASGGGVCKWPHRDVTIDASAIAFTQIPANRIRAIVADVIREINSLCGLQMRIVESEANIVSDDASRRTDRNLDGRGRTLAYAYLPCGARATTQLTQVYDSDELWSESMFRAVFAHETGHSLGLDHTDVPNSLLNPFFNPDITSFQRNDIEELQRRYGPPVATPEPPPPGPDDPADGSVNFTVTVGPNVYTGSAVLTPRGI